MAIESPETLNTTRLQDGQAAGSITPSDIRTVVDSLVGAVGTAKSSAYTLALVDRGTVIEFTAGTAVTLTVPANATVAFDVGTVIGVYQSGAGQVTVAPAAGVTIRCSSAALQTRVQYSELSLRKRATNEWVLSGDLA